jgi:ABC-2 type transport system ATP-binding protein
MDEPASGLDPRARIELRELLKVLSSRGKAILISSHILTELAEICSGAVIIERGKILQAGTLSELTQAADVGIRSISIRVLGSPADLLKHVLETPGIENAQMVDSIIEAEVVGGDDECAELLAKLLKDGFRVVEFRQRKMDLEQVFMKVTRGEVQ